MKIDPKEILVRVVRPFMYAGMELTKGAELTLDYAFAVEVITANKAVRIAAVAPATAPEIEPQREEKKTFSRSKSKTQEQ